eukprot:gnl/TRDRNA2_/TRDRNA2_135535_c0_seq1.p1 gnl/TRDRNA2_/TRDRNA2_135535_c0~~gnl/TRDRNA2_/TRDRNA2_135535_c0_seq1.p1  ORF type:complete len:481 (+),score=97.82 gnl/TRDRNA2_/TRDRNA2_135535_c0_seq1:70-1443(+)
MTDDPVDPLYAVGTAAAAVGHIDGSKGNAAGDALITGPGTDSGAGAAGSGSSVVQLDDFRLPAVLDGVGEWRDGARSWVSSNLPVLMTGDAGALEVMRSSDEWLGPGTAYARAAWRSVGGLAARLGRIYGAFEPLRPSYGKSALLVDKFAVRRLVGVVASLHDTSRVLAGLGSALVTVLDAVNEVRQLLARAAVHGEATGSGLARAVDAGGILSGMHLEKDMADMQGFAEAAQAHTKTFASAISLLSPLLHHLDAQAPSAFNQVKAAEAINPEDVRKDAAGSSLARADEQNYMETLDGILVAWSKLERLAMAICPAIARTRADTMETRCRVATLVAVGGGAQGQGQLSSAVATLDGTHPCMDMDSRGKDVCPLEQLSGHLKRRSGTPSFTYGGLFLAGAALCGGTTIVASALKRWSPRTISDARDAQSDEDGEEFAEMQNRDHELASDRAWASSPTC